MPYAIIRAGGHQEKVTPGEQITVDRLKQEVGQEVTWVPLVVSKDDGTVVTDKSQLQQGAKVVGKVLEHIRGEKLEIFQYRQKTGYRRHVGHRQPLTLVEIAEIRLGGETFVAPPVVEQSVVEQPDTERKQAEAAAKPKKKAAPKKAAPKAQKKAPAKKGAAKKGSSKKKK